MTREEKRAKVLKAASECFARYGYDKTTLEDIGKAVGLNKASLYYYYKNKEDIFTEVIFGEVEEFIKELRSKIKGNKSVETKIQNYLVERVNIFRMLMNLHNLSIDTIRKIEPIHQDLYEKLLAREEEFIAALLQEGIDSGEFTAFDTAKVAHAILTIAVSIRYRGLHISHAKMAAEADYNKIQECIRFSVKLILNGLKTTTV